MYAHKWWLAMVLGWRRWRARTRSGDARQAAMQVQASYPGVIELEVDASDLQRRIQRVRQRIPVSPGPLTLWYPQWIPGNHAPTGPINQMAGLVIRGNGQPLPWRATPATCTPSGCRCPKAWTRSMSSSSTCRPPPPTRAGWR
jgi:hypothetical protein